MSELGDYLRPLRGDMSLREASERSHGRISPAVCIPATTLPPITQGNKIE